MFEISLTVGEPVLISFYSSYNCFLLLLFLFEIPINIWFILKFVELFFSKLEMRSISRLNLEGPLTFVNVFFRYYISFPVLSINYLCTPGKSFSFVYEGKLHQTTFHWLFNTPWPDFVFTSCQASPTNIIARLKGKPLQMNDSVSWQDIFLQLCCLVRPNFSNLFLLVSTLNFVKAGKLKVGLSCYSSTKTWKLFQFGVHHNVCPLKFRVTFTLMSSSDLDRYDANNFIWTFFHRLDFFATLTVWRRCC